MKLRPAQWVQLIIIVLLSILVPIWLIYGFSVDPYERGVSCKNEYPFGSYCEAMCESTYNDEKVGQCIAGVKKTSSNQMDGWMLEDQISRMR